MKRCSRILLRVGFILGLVTAGCLFVSAVTFIILGLPPVVKELFKDNTDPDKDKAILIFIWAFISSGVMMAILGVFSILSSVFARRALNSNVRKDYILAIVFGALINEIVLAGSIVGLVAYRHDFPKADVIDVEAKDK